MEVNKIESEYFNILKWIDEDLQKVIIPILVEINLILDDKISNDVDALLQFDYRVEEYYKKIEINNLNIELQEYLRNWLSKVENRIYKILSPKN